MRDRVSAKPNRYAVYDDAHSFLRYEYHERADEPTQAGDALNKANLLPDAVATALGLTGNPQVKDALDKIKTLIDNNTALANGNAKIVSGSYVGTGVFGRTNKNRLVFPGTPLLAFIAKRGSPDNGSQAFLDGHSGALIGGAPSAFVNTQLYYNLNTSNTTNVLGWAISLTWESNALSWFNYKSAVEQLNISGETYYYCVVLI